MDQALRWPLLCLLQGSDFLHLPLSLVLPLACVMRMSMAEVQQLAVGDADMRAIFDDATAPIAQVRGSAVGLSVGPVCAGCMRWLCQDACSLWCMARQCCSSNGGACCAVRHRIVWLLADSMEQLTMYRDNHG